METKVEPVVEETKKVNEDAELVTEETEDQQDERLTKEVMEMQGISSDDQDENSEISDGEVKVEKTEDSKEIVDPVDDLLDKTRNGMQKRIDKLTAQKKDRDSENEQLRSRLDNLDRELRSLKDNGEKPKDSVSERQYSYEELDKAYEKALADNDMELIREIRKHERENYFRDAEKMVNKSQTASADEVKRLNSEWKEVTNRYVIYSDESGPELYPGSKTELNINDPNSKIVQLASAKYKNDERYRVPNGLVLAVSDAFKDILTLRASSSKKTVSNETLKKKVNKMNLKTSQGSSSSMKQDVSTEPSRPKSKKQELDDYIAERRRLSGN